MRVDDSLWVDWILDYTCMFHMCANNDFLDRVNEILKKREIKSLLG